MAMRGYMGRGFVVDLKDLQEKKHIKVIRNSGLVEYWIYRKPKLKSKLFNALGGNIYKTEKRPQLFAIIVCSNDEIGVDKSKGKAYIKGIRFTGKDINDYLRKTNRHVDNWFKEEWEK